MITWLLLLVACEPATAPGADTPDSPTTTTTSATTTSPTTTTSTVPTTTTVAVPEPTTTSTTVSLRPAPVIGYEVYDVPAGTRPHDVAPSGDGKVWYTGQRTGVLGRLDPSTGDIEEVDLGQGSAPHGVIVGPDGAAWVTDGGLDAIVRVDADTLAVDVFPVGVQNARLNTAAFDDAGVLWFTGQAGYYGRFDPRSEAMDVFDAPGGAGPYGITATPDGRIFYASLASSHIAEIDRNTSEATRIDPPTAQQGARRVWSDSQGRIWVAEWNAGQLGRFIPDTGVWDEWRLPGGSPQAYAVYVDETDTVWVTDFGSDHALVRFDPRSETFDRFPLPTAGGAVRQLLGTPGEVWGAESAADTLIVLRYER